MKARKIYTKLSLNKATVSNLSEPQMNDARGGVITLGNTCETCIPRICPTLAATVCVTCPETCLPCQ